LTFVTLLSSLCLFTKALRYNHGMPQLVQIWFEFALAGASHGYILKIHIYECTLLNTIMKGNIIYCVFVLLRKIGLGTPKQTFIYQILNLEGPSWNELFDW
jgi:hypothetical protein